MASSHTEGTGNRTLCPFCGQRAVNFTCKHCGSLIVYVLHAECQTCGNEDGGKVGGKCVKCETLQEYFLDVWKKDNEYIWLKIRGSSIVASMRGNFLTKNPFIQKKISSSSKLSVSAPTSPNSSIEKPVVKFLSEEEILFGTSSQADVSASTSQGYRPKLSLLSSQRSKIANPLLIRTIPSPASSFVVLGKDIYTGQRVILAQEARLSGLYVIGKTGSGKTTLLINLTRQDIEQGLGVCLIEPHGDAINQVLARLPATRLVDGVVHNTEDDVILLDPLDDDSFGLNLYHCDNPADDKQVNRTVDYVMEVFAKMFADGDIFFSHFPQMADVLRNTAYTLIANPGMTMAEIPLLLHDENVRAKLVRNVRNPQVLLFWQRYERKKPHEQDEFIASTINRLNVFLTNPIMLRILGQSKPTLNFREIIDCRPGKILLVKLSRGDEQLTALIGSMIVGQIANAVFSRSDTPEDKRIQFNLFCDEYQRFSTPTFADLLTEARKYKIATTVAHQLRGQLDPKNRDATLNAANWWCIR